MARGKKGGRGRGRGAGGSGGSHRKPDARTDAFTTDFSNPKFDTYYKAQNLIPEDEWDTFIKSFKETLPTTFRVTGSRSTAHDLNSVITNTYVPQLTNQVFDGQPIKPPAQIPWYPEGLAWQVNVHKTVIRKSPEFKKFQNFLVNETEVGNISRQEAVSMIPPLVLDVQPHHIVMDMCAAPGSKTAQLLEALHAAGPSPAGIVIANDSDYKRAHMLVHQSARMPSSALMVTNLDASNLPTIKIPYEEGAKGKGKGRPLLMDRILCDVPCSGDGTLRKNVGIWRSWQPMNANGLHNLQVRILQRAMRLLKEDGRIVYSTCSLNPIENEAVIAAAFNSFPGEFTLMETSSLLPQLERRPGVKTWAPVSDKDLTFVGTSWEEFYASLSESQKKETKMSEGQFPPKNVDELHLERCMRIYPHLQDTGGFFVAVIEKTNPISNPEIIATALETIPVAAEPVPHPSTGALKRTADELSDAEENEAKKPKTDAEVLATPAETSTSTQKITKKGAAEPGDTMPFNEQPYTFFKEDSKALETCLENLNISPDFPSANLFIRNSDVENPRAMYLCNHLVKEILASNDYTRIRLVSGGVKVFARQENGQGGDRTFRFVDDGIESVLPHVDEKHILKAGLKELKRMLETYYPLLEGFDEGFRKTLEGKNIGSYLLRFDPEEWQGASLRHPLTLPFWVSNRSTSLMTDKKAKSALSLRIFGEDVTPTGRQVVKQKQDKAAAIPGEEPSTAEGDDTRDGDDAMESGDIELVEEALAVDDEDN